MVQQIISARSNSPDIQPANQLIVHVFFKAATQWNYAGMAGAKTGLNYQSLELRASKIPEYAGLTLELQNRVWDGVQVMESECLTVWNQQSKQAK
ncbi:DUF1799 domain-containing protein [Rheinheimera gaetbuli]